MKKKRVSAGCFFTDGIFAIGGYQPHIRCVSGLGGKQEGDETPIQTAIRETIEEIFGITVPREMMLEFEALLSKRGPITKHESKEKDYMLFVMDYRHLELLCKFVKSKGVKSKYYEKIPETLKELLDRKIIDHAEVQHLELLDLKTYEIYYKLYKKDRPTLHSPLGHPICDFFISDMKWVFNYFQEHPPLLPPSASVGGP